MQVNSFKFKKCFYDEIQKLDNPNERLLLFKAINSFIFDDNIIEIDDNKVKKHWDSIFNEVKKNKN